MWHGVLGVGDSVYLLYGFGECAELGAFGVEAFEGRVVGAGEGDVWVFEPYAGDEYFLAGE